MLRRPKTITLQPRAPKLLKPQRARQLIRCFHTLQKNKAALLRNLARNDPEITSENYKVRLGEAYAQPYREFRPARGDVLRTDGLSHADAAAALARIDAEVDQRGGLHVYQMASTVGQDSHRGGDSLKWLVKWFGELGRTAERALEIGCLSAHNAISTSGRFGAVSRIDLHSQSPQIVQQDFMERPLPRLDADRFDVVSCSLVLNFVPMPKGRGAMLRRMAEFLRRDAPTPCVFLVLPLPCVANSRYFDLALLDRMMASLGFRQVRHHEAKKVAYWLYEWQGERAMAGFAHKKTELHLGPSRNNFYVELE